MKIVVTGTRGIPNILGGVETHCEELFSRISEKEDYDITIIRRENYAKDQLKEYKGIRLYDLKAPHTKAFEAIVHTMRAVYLAKFKLKADILHIHAIGPALAIPFAKMLGLKVVFTHHGPDYNRDKWGKTAKRMLRLGEKLGVKYADEVIVISNVIKDILKNEYGRTDAHLIYNGVAQPVFSTDREYLQSLGLEPRKYIFSMGRFVPEKNFHQLITTFASLKDKKGYRLVLVGDANFEDEYSKELKKMALENDVVLTGFIKGEKLYTLLNSASAFALPSSHEGLPIALLEAMSYQLPVIVSDIPANKDVNLPEENYFRVNDEAELTEKLQQHINEGYKPVSYDMTKYDWDKIAEQTLDVYQHLQLDNRKQK